MAGSNMASGRLKLPRDSTRQAEGLLYGRLNKTLNRWAGLVILLFLVVHLIGVASVRTDVFSGISELAPWLVGVHQSTWVRAVLFTAIAFHFLHSLKLVLMDLGMRVSYRSAFWTIVTVSGVVFLLEVSNYVRV